MGRITFITGPVRSGKSRFALDLAKGWGDGVVFVATYRVGAADEEMAQRVRRHQAERPASWRTLEAPEDLPTPLRLMDPAPSGVLLDCLTLWLSARMELDDQALLNEWDRVLVCLREAPWPSVIVGNEVGWSPVPESPELRRFRDLAGWLGQSTARAADDAHLCVAGCPLRLK